ncbi:MAG: ChbG/HpnK family deacetylase [Rubrivivax sp.]
MCVEDFGLHAGVNEAAVRLAAMDRVHALGCLVGGEGWSLAWNAVLRRLDTGGIDIGLHLDLTESPLLAGSRRRLPLLIGASLLRRLDAGAIRAEIRAQLDSFEQVLGHGPAFVDGHQHVHQLPLVRRELLDELVGRYRDTLPWLRSTRPTCVEWKSMFKARAIQLLGSRALNATARRMGFGQNNHLLGVYDFEGGPERYRELLGAWVRSAREADLLMCHAGLRQPEGGDPLAAAREAEYEVLAGSGFGAMLRDAGVALRPMSQILARRTRPA